MGFDPFRVDVDHLTEVRPAPVRPLPDVLDLTRDDARDWGLLLRGPKRRITPEDMRRIARAMGVRSGPPDLAD